MGICIDFESVILRSPIHISLLQLLAVTGRLLFREGTIEDEYRESLLIREGTIEDQYLIDQRGYYCG